MIKIFKPIKSVDGAKAKLTYRIIIDGIEKELYYQTEKELYEKLWDNTCDCVVVGLLPLFLTKGGKIHTELPISKRLLWGLYNHIIPMLCAINKEFKNIEFENIGLENITTTYSRKCGKTVTGLSCGIDSLYTIYRNLPIYNKIKGLDSFFIYNLNHLYHDRNEAENLFALEIKQKQVVAEYFKLPLIWVDSNLWEFLCGFRYIQIHSFYALSHCLLFQGYISMYLYSSGYSLNDFKADFSDTAHYDLYLSAFLKTELTEFLTDGEIVKRIDKTAFISEYDSSFKFLDVCNNKKLAKSKGLINCGCCDKCIRTQLTLDVLGLLENYSSVFDILSFNKMKKQYWTEYFYLNFRNKDTHMQEVISLAKKRRYKFPSFICFRCFLLFIKLQIRKLRN